MPVIWIVGLIIVGVIALILLYVFSRNLSLWMQALLSGGSALSV